MKTLVPTCIVNIHIIVCRDEKLQAHVHSSNLMLIGLLANVVVCDTQMNTKIKIFKIQRR